MREASILPALFKSFGPAFMIGTVLKLLDDLLIFVLPQILRLIIKFVEASTINPIDGTYGSGDGTKLAKLPKIPEREPLWHGIFFAVVLFAVAGLKTLLKSHHYYRMSIVGQRVRTALIAAIYRKALVLSNSARKKSTVGEIVNLMAVDAQRFMDLTVYINMIWSTPLLVTLAMYFLWDLLGPSVLAGE